MTMSVKWIDHNHTVIQQDIIGRCTWEDYNVHRDIVVEMMNSVNHAVSLIITLDNEAAMTLPTQLFWNARRLLRSLPDNHTTIILVGNHYIIQSVMKVLIRIAPRQIAKHLRSASTAEEAYRITGISS